MADEMLEQVRNRLLPMLQLVAEQYRPRVPEGYPVIVDAVPQGLIGLEIDPNYALYITSDGGQLYADYYYAHLATMSARPRAGRSSLALRSMTGGLSHRR